MSKEDGHRSSSPSADQISSAAAAMLKLSSSVPQQTKSPVYVMNETPVTSPSSAGSLSPGRIQMSPGGEYSMASRASRKQREFIPEYRKDDQYWVKRRKNNEAAKRSREKRRTNDMVMSQTIMELTNENKGLRRELDAIKRRFGIPVEQQFPHDKDDGEMDQSSGTDAAGPSPAPLDLKQEPRGEPQVQIPLSMPALSPIPGVARVVSSVAHPAPAPRLITPNGPMGLTAEHQSLLLSTAATHRQLAATSMCPVLPQGGHIPSRVAAPGIMGYHPIPVTPTTTSWSNGVTSDNHGPPGRRSGSPDPDSNDSSRSLKISLSAGASSSSDDSDNEHEKPLKIDTGNLKREPVDPKPQKRSSRSMARKGMPVKLRHKVANVDHDSAQEEWDSETHEPQGTSELNGSSNPDVYAQYHQGALSFPPRSSSNTSSDEASITSNNSSGKGFDPKYVERRRRNNMAARKCRENRKALTDMRIAKANLLENENTQLKEELMSLSTEISTLKDMLDKKKKALAKGETFELPPMDNLQENSSKDPSQEPAGGPS